MSMLVGQSLAYLKIGVIAFGLMAVVWGIVKFIEARAREKIGGGNEPDAN